MDYNSLNYGVGATPLEVQKSTMGGVSQVRTRYSIDDFLKLEAGSEMASAFESWQQALGEPPANWTPPEALSEIVSYVDVTPEDPMAFTMHNHRICPTTGTGGEWHNRPLRAYPEWLTNSICCAVEYLFCKTSKEPVFHHLVQSGVGPGLDRNYLRLLMPVADSNGEVVKLFYATRRITPNQRRVME